jgi:hypothetical protein
MNKILQSIFRIWNFVPLFQMRFLWLNKTPPKWDTPLSVQEGFDVSFRNTTFSPIEHDRISIDKYFWKTLSFEFGSGGAVLLLWAHFSPFLAWIAKNGIIRALLVLSSPLVINKWVKTIPKTKSFSLMLISPQGIESCLEWRRSMSYGVEAFVFAEDSNSLSIYLWLGLK